MIKRFPAKKEIKQTDVKRGNEDYINPYEEQVQLFDQSECLFCSKFGNQPFSQINFSSLLNKALYTKYSPPAKVRRSQDIENLINNESLPWVIEFKEHILQYDIEEYLKRFYKKDQIPAKIEQLVEYYKYHKDIPRLFMRKISDIAIFFHEKKKFMEYQSIKKMLGLPLDEDPTQTNCENPIKYSTLLKGLTCAQSRHSIINQELPSRVSTQSILKELIRGITERQNQSETWLSMPQQYSICDNSIKVFQDQSTGINRLEFEQDFSPVTIKLLKGNQSEKQQVNGQTTQKLKNLQIILEKNRLVSFQKKKVNSNQKITPTQINKLFEKQVNNKQLIPSGLQSIQTLSSQNSPKMKKTSTINLENYCTQKKLFPRNDLRKNNAQTNDIRSNDVRNQSSKKSNSKNNLSSKIKSQQIKNNNQPIKQSINKEQIPSKKDFIQFLKKLIFNDQLDKKQEQLIKSKPPQQSNLVSRQLSGILDARSKSIDFDFTKLQYSKTYQKEQFKTQYPATSNTTHRKTQTLHTDISYSPKNIDFQKNKKQSVFAKQLSQLVSNNIVVRKRGKEGKVYSQPSLSPNFLVSNGLQSPDYAPKKSQKLSSISLHSKAQLVELKNFVQNFYSVKNQVQQKKEKNKNK